MKIKHYICPRVCGKTTFAENLQMEDPSLLLIQRAYTVTSVDQLFKMFRGSEDSHNCYTGIIIDEFLPIANLKDYSKSKFIAFIKYLGVQDVTLISTPDKMYNPLDFEDENEMFEKFLKSNDTEHFELIETDFGHTKSESEMIRYKEMLGEEKYKTEILGIFLTNNKKEYKNDKSDKKYSSVRLGNIRFE